jgi:leader peptidase (prepilin peptidase)/N-methyltransferase
LGVSIAMMSKGLLRRSFADYEAWEKDALLAAETDAASQRPSSPADPAGSDEPTSDDHPAHMWIQYPHARREMVLELAFLAPPVVGALAGGWVAERVVSAFAGPWIVGEQGLIAPVLAPLWLTVLGAVCMGYLIGGGLVWAVRIFGTLLFGKEAMGLGDVHLMAAVGACLGWIDPTIAFFLAAFVGVGWAVLARVVGGTLNRAMPYGPFLAIATLLVVLGKPLIELGLGRLLSLGVPFDLP